MKDVCTKICKGCIIGGIWRKICSPLRGMAASAPETCQLINVCAPTIISRELPIGICRDERSENPPEDFK